MLRMENSGIKVKSFNSARKRVGDLLLKEALEDKATRRKTSDKDIAQGVKEIASDLGHKHKGRVFFVPDESYRRGYEKIKWR